MDIRYSGNARDVKCYDTEELRGEFLIQGLYLPETVTAIYSHVDRMIVLGVMPVSETVSIDKDFDVWKNLGTGYFLERREAGFFNIGGGSAARSVSSTSAEAEPSSSTAGSTGWAIRTAFISPRERAK